MGEREREREVVGERLIRTVWGNFGDRERIALRETDE